MDREQVKRSTLVCLGLRTNGSTGATGAAGTEPTLNPVARLTETFWHRKDTLPQPTTDKRTQLSIPRFMLWTLFVAVFSAVYSALPASALSFGFATAVAIGFLLIDALSSPRFRTSGVVSISFFACGLAYAVATGFFILVKFPPPMPPKPPLPFWAGVYYLASGGLLHDIGQGIANALAVLFQYLFIVVVATVVSASISLFTIRRGSQSKWLLLMNAPGILLCGLIVFAILYEALTTG